jgi:hypothetical protein
LPENGPKIVAITAFALEGYVNSVFKPDGRLYQQAVFRLKELAAFLENIQERQPEGDSTPGSTDE